MYIVTFTFQRYFLHAGDLLLMNVASLLVVFCLNKAMQSFYFIWHIFKYFEQERININKHYVISCMLISRHIYSICYSSTLMFNLLICKCNVFRHKVHVITIIILTLPHSGTRLGTRAVNESSAKFWQSWRRPVLLGHSVLIVF